MTLDEHTIRTLARRLEAAETGSYDVATITDEYPSLDEEDGYAIQRAICTLKESRGAHVVGLKVGLTSRAKMEQMGVNTPIFGLLFDYMAVPNGGVIETSKLIHPKVEAEIAFVLKASIRGPGCHIGTVLAATDFVVAAVEVIDSRYHNFRFDLSSVIADNTSASRFIVGDVPHDVEGFNLRTVGLVMEKNGETVSTAAGASVLGHPAAAVAQLANHLAKRQEEVPAGRYVMSGGATAAVAVKSGDAITVRYQEMGAISLRFR